MTRTFFQEMCAKGQILVIFSRGDLSTFLTKRNGAAESKVKALLHVAHTQWD